MRINIISVGNKMPSWVTEAFNDYKKRFANGWSIELFEIKPSKLQIGKENSLIEGKRILQLLTKNPSFVIALDTKGEQISTEELAQKLKFWQLSTSKITFLIGGPDGFSGECLAASNFKISLSNFTFPHPLVRVILIEQLYRCWTIIHGHPYHRA